MIQKYNGKLGNFEYDDTEFVIKKNLFSDNVLHYIGNETDGSKIKIPEGIINCTDMFNDCIELKTPPVIPEGVENCDYMFWDCKNLETAPVIPKGVTSCLGMFFNCISLEIPPAIPEGVIICSRMFSDCIALQAYSEPPENAISKGIYEGCDNLFWALLK